MSSSREGRDATNAKSRSLASTRETLQLTISVVEQSGMSGKFQQHGLSAQN